MCVLFQSVSHATSYQDQALNQIHDIEKEIADFEGISEFCLLRNGTCAPATSMMSFVFPSMQTTAQGMKSPAPPTPLLRYDGLGKSFGTCVPEPVYETSAACLKGTLAITSPQCQSALAQCLPVSFGGSAFCSCSAADRKLFADTGKLGTASLDTAIASINLAVSSDLNKQLIHKEYKPSTNQRASVLRSFFDFGAPLAGTVT